MKWIQDRDASIDLMRCLGLLLILFAHVNLPADNMWFQLRTFDVPMMIFISGLSYSGRDTGHYLSFVWKRAKRLLIPLYLFLTLFFLVHWASAALGWTEPIPADKIEGSYLMRLNPSINFVWIFRVFLIVMLITPPLVLLEKAVKRWWWVLLIFAAMLAGQWLLIDWLKPKDLGRLVNDWLLYVLGYGSVFFLGLGMRKCKTVPGIAIILVILVAFIPMAVGVAGERGSWLNMQAFKYPPGVYFILWGALMSCVLWVSRSLWRPITRVKPLIFIGQNTIWMYLWHITLGYSYYRSDAISYWLKFVLFLFVPLVIVILQQLAVDYLGRKHPGWKKYLVYFKG